MQCAAFFSRETATAHFFLGPRLRSLGSTPCTVTLNHSWNPTGQLDRSPRKYASRAKKAVHSPRRRLSVYIVKSSHLLGRCVSGVYRRNIHRPGFAEKHRPAPLSGKKSVSPSPTFPETFLCSSYCFKFHSLSHSFIKTHNWRYFGFNYAQRYVVNIDGVFECFEMLFYFS